MTTDTLHNSAMLAQLNISQWTARKHDRTVSAKVEQDHAAHDAGRYNKLLIDKAALEPISKIASAARTFHYRLTLPWGDNGDRLLPASLWEEYTKTLQGYKQEFDARVRTFINAYPQLRADAAKRLGKMYDPLEYPDITEVASKFEMVTEFSPVPSSGDFRVNLSADVVNYIREDLTNRLEARQRDAVKNCFERVKEVVSKIHERLADEDKTFRDTLITNAEELISILPALNITNDPELERLGVEVKDLLIHPDRLRQDTSLRAQTAARAADILARFDWGTK